MSKVRNIIKLYTEGVSKQSIGERTGLPRNSVKKYIRLFLASGKTLEEISQMSDTELEQMFLDMTPRNHIENDPRYKALEAFFPVMEKALKSRENTKEKLWQQYINLGEYCHPSLWSVGQKLYDDFFNNLGPLWDRLEIKKLINKFFDEKGEGYIMRLKLPRFSREP